MSYIHFLITLKAINGHVYELFSGTSVNSMQRIEV